VGEAIQTVARQAAAENVLDQKKWCRKAGRG
jgi:hypothetical protein